ncbi:MAG: threonine-phosphate decarboxylase [Gammaproteobacteria bacterium]|nr:threonine-phosphate decarboxylase [Gammaproteobacteria bacterium]MYD00961.1 threonine-phosphate decarboxylase [Gammaproteobacteria bacterium]MYI24529.1 threonine-phosphate decarboxylase [Gammaproteobacteria bacterium]
MNVVEVHGGALDAMRRLFPDAPNPWVDLSTGINPWPWPARESHFECLHRLPTQEDCARCAAAMAAAFGSPERAVLPAPGSELLIRLLPAVLAPRRVAILAPSYGDHARVWRAAGCEVVETPDPLAEADVADAVVICNPNNPDGRRFQPDEVEAAHRLLSTRGGWLVIDEAFADLEPGLSRAQQGGSDHLLMLRSIGKFYGLAGLRVGALLAPVEVLERMRALLGVWSVSPPALAIAAAAYSDGAWQTATRCRLAEARRRLDQLLQDSQCRVVGGTDLFRYVEVTDARGLWRQLARKGIYVRRFPWSSRHLRVGLPGNVGEARRLREALSP